MRQDKPSRGDSRRTPNAVAFCIAAGAAALLAGPASAQTVIYDGTQSTFKANSSTFTDTTLFSGSTVLQLAPNAGDGVWVSNAGSRHIGSVEGVGQAGVATGVDGAFGTLVASPAIANTVGMVYVLRDAGATTGRQKLNFSLYYNDPTPNSLDAANNANGGNVGFRVYGVTNNPVTDPAVNPWEGSFEVFAGSGSGGASIASGQYNRTNTVMATPGLVESLLVVTSAFDGVVSPGPDWQSISFDFDAGAGYDWLLFGFAGSTQDAAVAPADRFGFDNISFEAAPGQPGDFNGDGFVDAADYTVWRDNLNAADDGVILSGNGTGGAVDTDDYDLWAMNFGMPAVAAVGAVGVPEPSSVLLGSVAVAALIAAKRRLTVAGDRIA